MNLQEQQLKTLIENLPAFIIARNGRILTMTGPAAQMLAGTGLAAGTTPGRAGVKVVTESGAVLPAREQPWALAIARKHAWSIPAIGLHTHVRTLWFHVTCIPLPPGSGTPACLVLLTGITERKQAEANLTAELQFERAVSGCAASTLCTVISCGSCPHLLDVLSIVLKRRLCSRIRVFEHDGKLSVDGHLNAMIDIPAPTRRAPHRHFAWLPDYASWHPLLSHSGNMISLPTHTPSDAERAFLRTLRTSTAILLPLSSGGSWMGFIVFAGTGALHSGTDLGLLQSAAAAVARLLVRNQTQKRLLQTQRLETMGTLTSGLAHDFNNILAGIRASVEVLMLDMKKNPGATEDLAAIQTEVQRASDVVRQLLLFGQPTRQTLRPLRIHDSIRDMARLFRRTLPRPVHMELELAEEPATVRIDPTQFEQVLLNLVLNARDAMPHGGRITIRTLWSPVAPHPTPPGAARSELQIRVTDTGSGIPSDVLPRIFDPFFSTKEKGKGSGLGLAVVQSIIHKHGGTIQATSQAGEGTTFLIRFPAKLGRTVSKPVPVVAPARPGGGETILLVDDEGAMSKFTARFLERQGYRVLLAQDGHTALTLYKTHPEAISLVLLDFEMPDLDGPGCLKELLTINPGVRVIMMSGHQPGDGVPDPIQLGAKAFLQKPFDIQHAMDIMRRILDAKP